jgi:predicted anti-sigma-YlaC factor YlaD
MSRILICPDEHELLVVATGEPAADAIDEHLEGCPDCRQRVERLRAELAALRRDFQDQTAPEARTKGLPHRESPGERWGY